MLNRSLKTSVVDEIIDSEMQIWWYPKNYLLRRRYHWDPQHLLLMMYIISTTCRSVHYYNAQWCNRPIQQNDYEVLIHLYFEFSNISKLGQLNWAKSTQIFNKTLRNIKTAYIVWAWLWQINITDNDQIFEFASHLIDVCQRKRPAIFLRFSLRINPEITSDYRLSWEWSWLVDAITGWPLMLIYNQRPMIANWWWTIDLITVPPNENTYCCGKRNGNSTLLWYW